MTKQLTKSERIVAALTNPSGYWRCTRDENATTRKYQVFLPHPSLNKNYKFYVGKLGALRYGTTIKSSLSTDTEKFFARFEKVPANPPMPRETSTGKVLSTTKITGLPHPLPPGEHTIQVTDVQVEDRVVTTTARYVTPTPNYEEIERRMADGIADADVPDVLKLNADNPEYQADATPPRMLTGRSPHSPALHTITRTGTRRVTESGKDD